MRTPLLIVTLVMCFFSNAQQECGYTVFNSLYKAYSKNKISRNISFRQKTFQYDSTGKLVNTTVWHEFISFPNLFRINFDTLKNGRAVIFRNDSMYLINAGKIRTSKRDSNDLLLLLGGMYFREEADALNRLKSLINLSHCRDTVSEKITYTIIGDAKAQLWVDKKKLRIKRIILPDLDAEILGWTPNKKGWIENNIVFRHDGKIIQREEYFDIKFDVKTPASTFNPQTK